MISLRSFPLPAYCLRFDLTLSNTTIVSFIEYPSIVRSAVMKNVSTLNSGKKLDTSIYSPLEINTSWKSVMIVIIANVIELIPDTAPENAYATYTVIQIIAIKRVIFAVSFI